MASGKQLSFIYGEVSPSLRYLSTAVTYANGLFRLRNGYVRKTGGVSNRQGFKFIMQHPYQGQIPSPGERPGVVLSSYSDFIKEYEEYTPKSESILLSFSLPAIVGGAQPARILYAIHPRADFFKLIEFYIPSVLPDDVASNGGLPYKMHTFQTDKEVLLTFGDAQTDRGGMITLMKNPVSDVLDENAFTSPVTTSPAINITYSSGGLTPNLPVLYLIFQEDFDGNEYFIGYWDIAEHPDPPTGFHPHAQHSGVLSFERTVTSYGVKSYNIYRGQAPIAFGAAYGLVAKIAVTNPEETDFITGDYIVTADFTQGPPINTKLWGNQGTSLDYDDQHSLFKVSRVCTYQQRLIVLYDQEANVGFNKGAVGVSKAGATHMLHTPQVYNTLSAFEFTVPVDDGSSPVALLPMERLIIFTQSSVYVVRGGDQGILTPTTINPLRISREGCSDFIEPKMVGSNGYFITADHSKLMRITFTFDGNLQVSEVSELSEHVFREDIVKLEVTRTDVDTVWILRRDGSLISVTIQDETAGFAIHETSGYIESIAAISLPHYYWLTGGVNNEGYGAYFEPYRKDQTVLAATIIRDGVRLVEGMDPRVDRFEEGFAFADCYKHFGTRLFKDQFSSWTGIGFDGDIIPVAPVNITTSTDYEAGSDLTLTPSLPGPVFDVGDIVDFYYDSTYVNDDREEVTYKKCVRLEITAFDDSGAPSYTYTAVAEEALPAALQDVASQPIEAGEKSLRQTRYVTCVKTLTGLDHLAGKEVSVFADGAVISSPNNPDMPEALTVANDGSLELPDYFGFGTVGIPYVFEMITLSIEPQDNRTLSDANKTLNAVGVALHETRGGHYGSSGSGLDSSNMMPFDKDVADGALDIPPENVNGEFVPSVLGGWDAKGRAIIRQYDPLPISVLAVYPKGVSGDS